MSRKEELLEAYEDVLRLIQERENLGQREIRAIENADRLLSFIIDRKTGRPLTDILSDIVQAIGLESIQEFRLLKIKQKDLSYVEKLEGVYESVKR